MDDLITNSDNRNKDETNIKDFYTNNEQNSGEVDTSIFDKTLKEIDQILDNLEKQINIKEDKLEKREVLPEIKSVISKIHIAKNEITKEENNLIKSNNLVKRIENLEKNIINSNESVAEIKEHNIDKNLLSVEEIHSFKKQDETKKKRFFGFYSYLILIIVSFYGIYEVLNISKDLIVLNYPIAKPYIDYFYEIVEILKVSTINFFDFTKNKI